MTSVYVPEVICFIKNYKFLLKQNVHVHDYDAREKKDIYMFFCVIQISLKNLLTWEFDYIIRCLSI